MPRVATDTKNRIMQVARSLFSTHGCESTTLDDILMASGVTKGAFYHYFKSKESLCESVLDEVVEDYQRLAESIDDDLEPIEQLRGLLRKIVELNASGEWVNCKLILRFSTSSFESHPNVQRRIKNFWQWQSSLYEELIEKCRQAGQINTDVDAKMQTHLLISSLAGTVMLEKAAPDQASLG
ncbi:hypothetical protein LCGC14_2713280, partial [marine sediment metagenome]